jgi:hypothetical protein
MYDFVPGAVRNAKPNWKEMKIMNKPTCDSCDFWDKSNDPKVRVGVCCKRAPKPTGNPDVSCWAVTHETDWCGEHQDFLKWQERKRAEEEKGESSTNNNACNKCYFQLTGVSNKPCNECASWSNKPKFKLP